MPVKADIDHRALNRGPCAVKYKVQRKHAPSLVLSTFMLAQRRAYPFARATRANGAQCQ